MGSQRPGVRHPAKPFKHTHPHHDPHPLSEEIWEFPIIRVPYFGVLIIRILLFGGTIFGPPRSETRILPAQGRGMLRKTVLVPRKGARSQSCTGTPPPGRRNHPTATCYPSHSPSHGSKPLALKVVLANTHSHCVPSVSAGRNGPSRKTFLSGRGIGLA